MNKGAETLPLKVAAIMRDFGPGWFIAGGWAIDLYLGEVTRPHADVEIAVFRRDQAALYDYLGGWLLRKVVRGERLAWRGEPLELPVHELSCFKETAEPPHLEVLLNETSGDEWVYRRNPGVRRSLAKFHLLSDSGVRFVCPEVVLLYKSKNPRGKDERDFAAVAARLDAERRGWLRDAIALCCPEHHWLRSL